MTLGAKIKVWVQLISTVGLALTVVYSGIIAWQGDTSLPAALDHAANLDKVVSTFTLP